MRLFASRFSGLRDGCGQGICIGPPEAAPQYCETSGNRFFQAVFYAIRVQRRSDSRKGSRREALGQRTRMEGS